MNEKMVYLSLKMSNLVNEAQFYMSFEIGKKRILFLFVYKLVYLFYLSEDLSIN